MDHPGLITTARLLVKRIELSRPDLDAGTVGSALLTASGRLCSGICVSLTCGLGTCAEHAAVLEMLKHGETHIAKIVAVSRKGILPPCGRCRELLVQVDRRNFATEVILGDDRTVHLGELLPAHWMNTD